MTEDADATRPQASVPPSAPPFDPDLELIGHLEGNERELRGYRKTAQGPKDQARREAAGQVARG